MARGKYIRTEEIREKSRVSSREAFIKHPELREKHSIAIRNKGLIREKSHMWKGGKRMNDAGYIMIYSPEHPFANRANYVREHRLVMEKVLGRYLLPTEVVHHRNGIKADNRIENLQLVNSNSEHHIGHKLHPWLPKRKQCVICSEPHVARGYCESHYWQYFLKGHRAGKW